MATNKNLIDEKDCKLRRVLTCGHIKLWRTDKWVNTPICKECAGRPTRGVVRLEAKEGSKWVETTPPKGAKLAQAKPSNGKPAVKAVAKATTTKPAAKKAAAAKKSPAKKAVAKKATAAKKGAASKPLAKPMAPRKAVAAVPARKAAKRITKRTK